MLVNDAREKRGRGGRKKRLAIYDLSLFTYGVRTSMRKTAQNRGVLFPLFEKVQVSAAADRDMDVSTSTCTTYTLNILHVFLFLPFGEKLHDRRSRVTGSERVKNYVLIIRLFFFVSPCLLSIVMHCDLRDARTKRFRTDVSVFKIGYYFFFIILVMIVLIN